MPTDAEWNELDEAAMRLDSALNLIGEPGKTDHDLARLIVENELLLRKLVNHTLAETTAAVRRA